MSSTIGHVDRPYIEIDCPGKKMRSAYVKRYYYLYLILKAIYDHQRPYLDVTIGHPRKVHDVFSISNMTEKPPQMCRRRQFQMLGDAT